MAVVDETESLNSSLHKDRTDHTSNQSASMCSPKSRVTSELDSDPDGNIPCPAAEVVSLESSKENINLDIGDDTDEDDDDDDDDDDATSDYLLDSLLSRNIKSHLSLDSSTLKGRPPPLTGGGRPSLRSELDRTYSQRSLRSSGNDLDRTYSSRSLQCNGPTSLDDGWDTTSSVHSSITDISDKKNWEGMDSVHSSTAAMSSEFGNSSMDFNDSCCSFASFGGSDSDMDNSASDLSMQRAAFTSLVEQPTPRRIMLKSQSVRTMKRGMSFRGTGLSLIEESNSLD